MPTSPPLSQLHRGHVRAGRAAVCGDPSGVGAPHGREHGPGAERRGGGPARRGRVLPAQRGHPGAHPTPHPQLSFLPPLPPSHTGVYSPNISGACPVLGGRPAPPRAPLLTTRGFRQTEQVWASSPVLLAAAPLGSPAGSCSHAACEKPGPRGTAALGVVCPRAELESRLSDGWPGILSASSPGCLCAPRPRAPCSPSPDSAPPLPEQLSVHETHQTAEADRGGLQQGPPVEQRGGEWAGAGLSPRSRLRPCSGLVAHRGMKPECTREGSAQCGAGPGAGPWVSVQKRRVGTRPGVGRLLGRGNLSWAFKGGWSRRPGGGEA